MGIRNWNIFNNASFLEYKVGKVRDDGKIFKRGNSPREKKIKTRGKL